jgi:hypothetical protein
VNDRGQYGKASFRSRGRGGHATRVGDDTIMVRQLDNDWSALYQRLASQVGALTPDPKAPSGYHYTTQAEYNWLNPDPAKVAWWKSTALPLIKQWVQFKHEQLGGRGAVEDFLFQPPNWNVWKSILIELRAEAQRRGFSVVPISHVGALVDTSALYMHTVGDREEAVKRLARSMTSTYVDLATQVGVIPDAGSAERVKKNPLWYSWWKGSAAPFFKDWNKFHAEQVREGDNSLLAQYIAYGERFSTAWSTYQDWAQRLEGIRAGALAVGLRLTTPEPEHLPTSLPEDVIHAVKKGASAVATGVGDVWSIAKWGVIGALAIGGVIALSSVASNLRSGHDPAEKYMELARSRRRPRELPTPPRRLALPPGVPMMEGV